jgi:hypothetical protein
MGKNWFYFSFKVAPGFAYGYAAASGGKTGQKSGIGF